MSFDESKVLVTDDNSVGVVGWDHGCFHCYLCPPVPKLDHVKFVDDNKSKEEDYPQLENLLLHKDNLRGSYSSIIE